jgi:hypothetical protein
MTHEWQWHRRRWRDRQMLATAGAWWFVGVDIGWFGLGVVRELWGWRIMLGIWHLCGRKEVRP